jgi:hypothetical protein
MRRVRPVVVATGLAVPSLYPVRNGGSTKLATLGAPHTRAEGWHRDVIRLGVDADLGVVAAMQAGDIEPAHAVPAHVAQRHRLDRLVAPGHRCCTAYSRHASALNSFAAFSIAALLSGASTVPSHTAFFATL